MTYTFQATGDETEIFREDDENAVAVVLVPFLDSETPDAHQRRVALLVQGMNAAEGMRDDHHASGNMPAILRILHGLAAQAWNKGPHETDATFSDALVAAGDVLAIHGQNIHDDFDLEAAMSVLGGEWIWLRTVHDEALVRARSIEAGLEMAFDTHEEMMTSPIGQSGEMAQAISKLQKAVMGGTEAEAHAAGAAVESTAYALHQEAVTLLGAMNRSRSEGDHSAAIVKDIVRIVRERQDMRTKMPGDANVTLALELETLQLKIDMAIAAARKGN